MPYNMQKDFAVCIIMKTELQKKIFCLNRLSDSQICLFLIR
jgi:hypothetical protein